MAGPLNAKVIMAKCSKTQKTFGIRIEQRGGDWLRTWAFPIDERRARSEGFDANTVSGSMSPGDGYPGCPHCGDNGITQCGCGKIGCQGGGGTLGSHTEYTCPWCGDSFTPVPAYSLNVKSGDY